MARPRIPQGVVLEVLAKCLRRCACCAVYGVPGTQRPNYTFTHGVLHHINGDPADNRVENLVYLCVDHHRLAETSSSMDRGLSAAEVRWCKAHIEHWVANDFAQQDGSSPSEILLSRALAVIDATPLPMGFIDPPGTILAANEALLTLSGTDDLVGQHLGRLIGLLAHRVVTPPSGPFVPDQQRTVGEGTMFPGRVVTLSGIFSLDDAHVAGASGDHLVRMTCWPVIDSDLKQVGSFLLYVIHPKGNSGSGLFAPLPSVVFSP